MAALFTGDALRAARNGPVIGVITARTPAELRPKMMTALISIATLAAPLGFLVAGQLLEPWGVNERLRRRRGGMTATALVFAAIASATARSRLRGSADAERSASRPG